MEPVVEFEADNKELRRRFLSPPHCSSAEDELALGFLGEPPTSVGGGARSGKRQIRQLDHLVA
jgi:hypothetical protein